MSDTMNRTKNTTARISAMYKATPSNRQKPKTAATKAITKKINAQRNMVATPHRVGRATKDREPLDILAASLRCPGQPSCLPLATGTPVEHKSGQEATESG